MDPIIRAAAVSKVAFELRRPAARSEAQPRSAAAPATPVAPATPAPATRTAIANPAPTTPAPLASFAAPPVFAPPPAAQAPLQANPAAQQETARLAAQAELAELRAEAERRGYAAGHEKGEAEARRQLQSQIERFQGLAAQMVQARAGVLEDGEDDVVELAYASLCRILGEQGATREGVMAMVGQGLRAVRAREQVVVRLHPDDHALMGQQTGFRADPAIALGGCIVDSSTGALDARLETQLALLADTLLAVRAARRGGQEEL